MDTMDNMEKTKHIGTTEKAPRGMLGTVIAILVVLTLLSATLLTVRLVNYIKMDERELQLQAGADRWMDIFSVRYSNASGEITVSGTNGQKVVAPGLKVEYTIRLRNKDKVAIDCDLIPSVVYTSEYSVPVVFRMIDDDGNYLIGDEKTWASAEQISQISDKRTLRKGESTEYVLQWKWEFETGDDGYDTFLGSLDESAGLSVKLELHAEANTDVDANGGIMGSGLGHIFIAALVLLLLIAALVLLIVYIVKKCKRADKDTPETAQETLEETTEEVAQETTEEITQAYDESR